MADDGNQENGNRATVALVDSKVDTVLAEVRGGFKDVQRQLDDVAGLPVKVANIDARLKAVEDDTRYRRVNVPALILSALAVGVAALSYFG